MLLCVVFENSTQTVVEMQVLWGKTDYVHAH